MIKKLKKVFFTWLARQIGLQGLITGNQLLDRRLKIIEGMVRIGADIHAESDSWIVMCIAGNPDYVEFFKLPKQELRNIQQILKQLSDLYGPRNVRVDVPPSCRHMFRL